MSAQEAKFLFALAFAINVGSDKRTIPKPITAKIKYKVFLLFL